MTNAAVKILMPAYKPKRRSDRIVKVDSNLRCATLGAIRNFSAKTTTIDRLNFVVD